MTVTDDTAAPAPEEDGAEAGDSPRRSRRFAAGVGALSVALIVLLVITFLPTSYVIQQPGPVYDTLGTAKNADGEEVPLIEVEGAQTYPTEGSLDLLTVQVVGNPDNPPSWVELAAAWFDRTKAVLPMESVFPTGQTTEEREQESTAMMVDSQQEATAAALSELGYDVGAELTIVDVPEGSASTDILEPEDVIVAVDGTAVDDVTAVREIVAAGAGAPVDITVRRDGEEQTLTVTPTASESDGETTWLLGISLTTTYDFPIDVTIQLNNVGGPSAGMMFALGIIDTLTPGALNGGDEVAGTGTITGDGTVGPIGGIRQKLWGAKDSGAEWFLAPEANCDEVVGHVPDGLQVFSVATLDESLDVLDAISGGGDLDALPTCESPED